MINKICQAEKESNSDTSKETAGYSCSDSLNSQVTQNLMNNSVGDANISNKSSFIYSVDKSLLIANFVPGGWDTVVFKIYIVCLLVRKNKRRDSV
jgi:hypothetical protein